VKPSSARYSIEPLAKPKFSSAPNALWVSHAIAVSLYISISSIVHVCAFHSAPRLRHRACQNRTWRGSLHYQRSLGTPCPPSAFSRCCLRNTLCGGCVNVEGNCYIAPKTRPASLRAQPTNSVGVAKLRFATGSIVLTRLGMMPTCVMAVPGTASTTSEAQHFVLVVVQHSDVGA
jgi:hypothetical protein